MKLSLEKNKDRSVDKIVKGALSLSIAAILVKILGVIYKIPISYLLGDEGMGYFNSAYTVYSFFYIICSAGVPKAVTMLIAEVNLHSGSGGVRAVFRKVLRIFTLIGILVALIFLIFSPAISIWIGNKKSFSSMLAIIPSLVFICISGVLRGYLNGIMNMLPIALSQLIEAALKLIFGLLFAYIGTLIKLPLEHICALSVFGITLSSIFSTVFLLIKCKKKNREENIGQNTIYTNKELAVRITKIALPITFSSSVLALSSIFDLVLIMRRLVSVGYTEQAASGLYGNYTTLAVPMLNLVISIVAPISIAVLPKLRADLLLSDNYAFTKNINGAIKATVMICAPCAFMYYAYSYELLDILFSRDAALVGAPMLAILSPGVILLGLLTVFNTALEAMGKIKLAVLSTILGALIKLITGYFLIGNSGIGISGAPLGTVLSYGISLIFSAAVLTSCGCKIKIFSSLLLPIAWAYISVFVPLYLKISIFGQEKSILTCIIFCLLSVIIYFVGVLSMYGRSKRQKILVKSKQNNY